jgi:hypothetical protein
MQVCLDISKRNLYVNYFYLLIKRNKKQFSTDKTVQLSELKKVKLNKKWRELYIVLNI